MRRKFHVKKGDTVIVIAGESKGQKGQVREVLVKKSRAIVSGVNMIKKHQKPNTKFPQGGIIDMEAPIHLSNLMVVDSAGKPTRIGRKQDSKTGKLVRYSKKSGEVIK
ncbi:MAG: 50S ribosomal protein L24 [Bacteroidales bacterium]|jgi:large subunit ribosomal protein L24|nr:50S ribosomal protein L24 [Bacteroidales bacterium]